MILLIGLGTEKQMDDSITDIRYIEFIKGKVESWGRRIQVNLSFTMNSLKSDEHNCVSLNLSFKMNSLKYNKIKNQLKINMCSFIR